MTIEEIETRLSEITNEIEQPEANLDDLQEEVRKLNAEKAELRKLAQQAEEARKAVADGAGETKEERKEDKVMTLEEVRNSAEYVNAFADYIKTGDARECRGILKTVNAEAGGQLPVPILVDNYIQHAWESNEFLSRVKRTYIRGNLKIAFERAGDVAYVHPEGGTAPTEESLTIGIVTLTPETIKKWIRLSDEALAMGGEEFLRYIYDELSYQIARKLVEELIGDVDAAQTTNQATSIGIPKVALAPGLVTIATAIANLTDEARDLCVAMNPLTEVKFKEARANGNFAIDPFEGLPVVRTSKLPAYDTASAGDMYAIVGDLGAIQVNYPEGDDVALKFDDLTEAEKDLIKIVGRQYAGHGVTAPGRLVKLTVPEAPATT